MLYRGHHYYGGGFGNDSRKKFFVRDGDRACRSTSSTARSTCTTSSVTYRPTPAIRVSLVAALQPTARGGAVRDHGAGHRHTQPTYGKQYVFATLDQRTVDIGIRTEWTASSRLSLQLYLQPFIASGDYSGFKYLTRPRDDEFTPLNALDYDAGENSYRSAGANAVAFSNPDFNFRSVRGSAVVRWEFRPGSAHVRRLEREPRGRRRRKATSASAATSRALPHAPSHDVFLVKFSYWLPI